MKIGVKIYNEKKFLDYFEDKADFFEVQAIQRYDYDFLKKYKKPFVIHAEHFTQGSNPADETMIKQNLKSLKFAQKLADKTKAKKIIFHPGRIENHDCSKEQSIKFIKGIRDKRILIENLFYKNPVILTPADIKDFMEKTNNKFCFDFSHAIAAANITKVNPYLFIKEFLKLKPAHYHIGGQKINSKVDSHCSFFDKKSDIPIKNFLSLLPSNAEITLEVTKNIKKTEKDLEYVQEIVLGM